MTFTQHCLKSYMTKPDPPLPLNIPKGGVRASCTSARHTDRIHQWPTTVMSHDSRMELFEATHII